MKLVGPHSSLSSRILRPERGLKSESGSFDWCHSWVTDHALPAELAEILPLMVLRTAWRLKSSREWGYHVTKKLPAEKCNHLMPVLTTRCGWYLRSDCTFRWKFLAIHLELSRTAYFKQQYYYDNRIRNQSQE